MCHVIAQRGKARFDLFNGIQKVDADPLNSGVLPIVLEWTS